MDLIFDWLQANLTTILIAAIPLIGQLLLLRKIRSESKKIDSESKKISSEAEKTDTETEGLVIRNTNEIVALWQSAYKELKDKFDILLKKSLEQDLNLQSLHDEYTSLKSKQKALLQFVTSVLDVVKEPRSDVFSITDEKKIVLYVSPNVFEMLGYSPLDFLNKERTDLLHPNDLDNFMKIFSHTLQFPEITSKIIARYKHRDGSWRWVESTIMNLLQTHVRGIFFASRDITKLKEAEAELKKLYVE